MPKAAGSPIANDIEANAIVCRICLDHEDTPSNPLLRPCHCKGSMAYVHRNCLNKWRRRSINPNSIYQCDTCKFEYRFATAIRPDRFTIARVLAWPISIHLLSVMGLFWLCFAGGFDSSFWLTPLTWSDIKSGFNTNHLLIGATAIGLTVSYCFLVLVASEFYGLTVSICLSILLMLCFDGAFHEKWWSHWHYTGTWGGTGYNESLTHEARKGMGMVYTVLLVLAVVAGLSFVYIWMYLLLASLTGSSRRGAAAREVGAAAAAAAAAQHVVLDVGAGHDNEEDGEANRGSFGGVEDTAHAQEHGNGNEPHPLERQPLIARP